MNKSDFFSKISVLGKALDSPERLRIIDSLCQAERTVEDLASVLDLPVKTVSHHLQKLKSSGFVSFQKKGRYSLYSVSCTGIITLMSNLKNLSIELLPDMKLHMKELETTRHKFQCSDDSNLTDLVKSGKVLIIDVRDTEEFNSAHLPAAVSVPFNELENFISKFKDTRTVLAYCSDIFCDLADRAVTQMRKAGLTAFRLEDSVTGRISQKLWRDQISETLHIEKGK
ncbi:MAG: metalloregulator ArsR/SmtB family transcription factor [Candidatus Aegiribacteria sp.]|nr:metalloregulator ArsR/SmtB family transcription factor [Candidatus Aegiribacteria sp.]